MFGLNKDPSKVEDKKEEEKDKDAQPASKADGAGDAAGGGVSNMRSGDYMVHVFIEKVKEINIPEEGGTVDPMFHIECLGQKTHSSSKDDIGGLGEVVFSEHLFLEPRGVDRKDAEEGKIMIKLVDKGLFKDTLIGLFELDLGFIYSQKDHTLLHRWLAFSNPNGEDYAKIQCYVKLSISVVCEGDKQIQIEDDDGAENPNVMMSPALNPKFFQVKIRIFSGHDLPMMDSALVPFSKAKIDAYMHLLFKGKNYKTPIKVYEKGDAPIHWNTEFWLPCQLPVAAPQIPIRLMDQDDFVDEIAATMLLYTKEIIENKYGTNGQFIWKNLYGSPMNQSASQAKSLMNENPAYASNWKGRVLIQILAEQTEKPLAKQIPIDPEIVKEAAKYLQLQKYSMIASIGQAVALPTVDKYKMRITVGGHEIMLNPIEQKKAVTSKRYQISGQIDFDSYFQSVEDFESVIVQLMDGDNPIMFYRDRIDKFKEIDPQRMEWYQFIPDKCVNKITEPWQVGQFSFKLALVKNEQIGFDDKKQPIYKVKFMDMPNWKKQSKNKRLNAVRVRAYIYQARNLPAADAEGTSDPYIKVWDTTSTEKKYKKTKIVEDNCNPLFYQCLELEYEVEKQDDLLTYPPFIFDLFDWDDDFLDSTDDYLCRCIVEPEDCAILTEEAFEKCKIHNQEKCNLCQGLHLEIPQEPRWHPCYFAPGQPKCGELLVSFSVTKDEYEYAIADPEEIDLDALVPKRENTISMNILGMRNLASPGLLPVKKAFIKFAIKSLVPPNGPALKDIMTTPSQAGPNPTLNTTTHFTIPLPVDILYCPQLTCFVYDNVFAGLAQPLIGVFTLPLGDLKEALAKERKEETQVIKDIIKAIKELCSDELQDLRLSTSIRDTDMNRGSSSTTNMLMTSANIMPINQSEYFQSSNLQSSKMTTNLPMSKYSRFSEKEAEDKLLTTQKKRKVKKVMDDKDLGETLGPNADEGEINAKEQQESQLQLVEQKKQQIIESQKPADKVAGSVQGSRRGSQASGSKMSKRDALDQLKQMKDMTSRIEEDERQRQRESMIAGGHDSTAVVIMPRYKTDERLKVDRETNIPPKELFIGLGWDEDSTTKRKHYRHYYNCELEKVKEIFEKESPFNSYKIMRGQSRGNTGGFFKAASKDESGQESTEKCAGIFKAIIEVENPQDKLEYNKKKSDLLSKLQEICNTLSEKKVNEKFPFDILKLDNPLLRKKFDLETRKLGIDHLNISKALANLNSDEILKRALLKVEKCIIRFYAIEGFNMSSRDNGSASDTYLALECNDKRVSERDNYQLDEPNPKFYKYYDFEGYFPGSSPLTIQVWDYDMVFGDELVGTSILDLEDRYFTLDWMGLPEYPVEYRNLYHPSSKMEQGVVKCWLEIIKVNDPPESKPPIFDISPKPLYDIQIRICVHDCKEIPMMDAEGTCDAFFRGFFDTKEDVQETDTHYRNQDGKPDFQYRFVFNKNFPDKTTKFQLQGWDRDFFKSNDMIGEASIELADIMEDVSLVKQQLQFNKKYYNDVIKPKIKDDKSRIIEFDAKDDNKIWLTLWAKNSKGVKEKKGKVAIQICVIPVVLANANPVGKARDLPNHSPMLPQPQGRLELSFNPIKMLNQLVGPALRRKIYMACCCAFCCFLILMSLPNIMGGLMLKII